MSNLWHKFVHGFLQFAPSIVVCLTFLPTGLVFGYTIASFVAERNNNLGAIEYGPLILGACCGLLAALGMFLMKFYKGRIIYWHINILLVAASFHLISSIFYFISGFDNVGAFISYVGHSLTFVAGFSFLHTIPGRCTRAILMSSCFSVYLLGMASAMSLIGTTYSKNLQEQEDGTVIQPTDGIYVNFAGVYLSMSAVVLAALIGLTVLTFLGTMDCETSMDNELRIANSNGSIFDNRSSIIKRIQFFYVTHNQQWYVALLLVYAAAIQYALFIYFVFWFSLNDAMRLTDIANVDLMMWMIFLGSVGGTVVLVFVSVKANFVANQLFLIVLAVLAMIISTAVQTSVPFWLILFFFGLCFSNLQIALIEVSHFRYTELLIYASYLLNLVSISIVYYYFVANNRNLFFYSTDVSTLMAQGFIFIIITSLLALVVGMKLPRTHRTSLFDIQYELLGIIFMKHQIEQLNVKWLNDGTIPTIARPDEY